MRGDGGAPAADGDRKFPEARIGKRPNCQSSTIKAKIEYGIALVIPRHALWRPESATIAAKPSTMTELGRKAPHFALPDVFTGQTVFLEDFEGRKALLIMFICKHCPYVLQVKPALIQLAMDYADQPLGIVSINVG